MKIIGYKCDKCGQRFETLGGKPSKLSYGEYSVFIRFELCPSCEQYVIENFIKPMYEINDKVKSWLYGAYIDIDIRSDERTAFEF